MKRSLKVKSEKRSSKKKKRRYPISGRSVFLLKEIKEKFKRSGPTPKIKAGNNKSLSATTAAPNNA